MLITTASDPANMARVSPPGMSAGGLSWLAHHPLSGFVVETSSPYRSQSYLPATYRPEPPAAEAVEPLRGPAFWEMRVRELGIEADRSSETFRAAMMLIAGLELGHNVDRIARRTGTARPFASKAARRLIDNGVWTGGETVGLWVRDPSEREAFARDVAVAEGKLLRRLGAGGRLEWAPAGHWNKSFERNGDQSSLSVTYFDAAPRGEEPLPLAAELEQQQVAPAPRDIQPLNTPPRLPMRDVAPPAPRKDAGMERPGNAPSLEEVFSDAVWLR